MVKVSLAKARFIFVNSTTLYLTHCMKQLTIIFFILAVAKNVSAQNLGNAFLYSNLESYNKREVKPEISATQFSLSVSGLLNVKADSYVATFSIIQVGETAESTNRIMAERVNQFIRALKAIGIETDVVKTDMVSFVPKFGY